jgi:hypothetical protein
MRRCIETGSVVDTLRTILRQNKMNDVPSVSCLKTDPGSYFGIELVAEMMTGTTLARRVKVV